MLETGHYQFFEGGRFGQLQKKKFSSCTAKTVEKNRARGAMGKKIEQVFFQVHCLTFKKHSCTSYCPGTTLR